MNTYVWMTIETFFYLFLCAHWGEFWGLTMNWYLLNCKGVELRIQFSILLLPQCFPNLSLFCINFYIKLHYGSLSDSQRIL